MISAAPHADVEKAREKYYIELADHFLEQVSLKRVNRILEAGCGKGQLTIPLLSKLPRRIKFIAVDSSRGSYAGSFETLLSRLGESGRKHGVRAVKADIRNIKSVAQRSVDLVISNELLCDLKHETQVVRAFKEFGRILRPGGMMVHGEWMSKPLNEAQAITIRADTSEGTDTPSKFWNPDQLHSLARAANFHRTSVSYFQRTISFPYETAVAELRDWGVRESFLKRNHMALKRYGIQLPYEHVIACQKP